MGWSRLLAARRLRKGASVLEALALFAVVGGLIWGIDALDRWHQRHAMRCAIRDTLAHEEMLRTLRSHRKRLVK